MRNDGYKLARRFMNSKDIFKVVKNLVKVGYSCEIVNTDKDDPNFNFGFVKNILVKYVGNDNKSILPLYVFYKDKQQEHDNDFKQEVQVRYHY
jgi:hypothetical protein